MNVLTSTRWITSFTLVFLTLCFLNSCKNVKNNNVVTEVETPMAIEISKHFFHAWLADCVNDLSFEEQESTAKTYLRWMAQQRITGAINDPNITNVFGTETLVWGPQITVDQQQNSDYYVAENLIYCLKSVDPSGIVNYSVGIAGTNMISPFDWFTEDLAVQNQVNWLPGGKISQGSSTGLNILNGLTDSITNLTLAAFLNSELTNDPTAVISVAGHSLGGAMTQVYSSQLKYALGLNNKPVVKAWVYAGPTAGDQVFADSLVQQLDAYNAYNNTLDLVPHAWQNSSLNQLCNIYNGLSICSSPIQNNVCVNGVVKYLNNISEQGNYTIPGNPVTFTGAAVNFDGDEECLGIYAAGLYLYDQLNTIAKQCSASSDITDDDAYGFLYYFVEMGGQHTTAYFNYFFQDQNTAFTNAVDNYVPGAKSDWGDISNLDEGKIILSNFLNTVSAGLPSNPQDCSCKN